jgi:hypothetical protein
MTTVIRDDEPMDEGKCIMVPEHEPEHRPRRRSMLQGRARQENCACKRLSRQVEALACRNMKRIHAPGICN